MSAASNAHRAVTHAFPSSKAQKWVLAAAVITALAYGFRRLIEPSVTSAPAHGGKVAQLIGAGGPPPPMGQWAVAYGVGFIALAFMAELAPELAAALAGMEITGVVLGNSSGVVTDLAKLGVSASSPTSIAAAAQPPGVASLSPSEAAATAAAQTARQGVTAG